MVYTPGNRDTDAIATSRRVLRAVAIDESARILLVVTPMTNRRLAVTMVALLEAAGAVGCSEKPTLADMPDPRICTTTWRTVYRPDDQTFLAPFGREHTMAVYGQQIYLNANEGHGERDGLWVIPTVGGPATQVHAGSLWSFWIEDDDLIFAEGSTLYRMPIKGGDSQPILTYHIFDPGLSSRFVASWALDRDALYWVLYDFVAFTVWRSPRDGSGDQQIATLPTPPSSTASAVRLTLMGDQVFVISDTEALVRRVGAKSGQFRRPRPSRVNRLPWRRTAACFGGAAWATPTTTAASSFASRQTPRPVTLSGRSTP
jgi:hypothetical protein